MFYILVLRCYMCTRVITHTHNPCKYMKNFSNLQINVSQSGVLCGDGEVLGVGFSVKIYAIWMEV